jgi:hypothetical protein
VTLDGADHLLVNRPGDAEFVAELLATWLARVIARSSNPRIDHG